MRRVRGATDGERPRTALGLAVSVVLIAVALAAGGLLFAVVLPDGFGRGHDAAPRPATDEPAADDGRGRAGSIRPDDAITGGGAAASSGFRSLLRTSPIIELTVRVDDGLRGPEPLFLRGMTYDVFDGKTWTRSAAADASSIRDAGADGWVDVAPPTPSRPSWRLRVEDVGGRAARDRVVDAARHRAGAPRGPDPRDGAAAVRGRGVVRRPSRGVGRWPST